MGTSQTEPPWKPTPLPSAMDSNPKAQPCKTCAIALQNKASWS